MNFRSWMTRITDGEYISGCCWWDGLIYCIFMRGPIVVLDQINGIKKKIVKVQ